MKSIFIILVFVLTILGCGADDDSTTSSTPAESLNGSWVIEINDSCGYGFTVNNSTYVFQTACVDGNRVYTEVEVGSISATDKTLTMTNEKNSCANIAKSTDTVSYSMSSDKRTLNVSLPGRLLSFNKYEGESGGGNLIIEYGCYSEDGDFVSTPNFTI